MCHNLRVIKGLFSSSCKNTDVYLSPGVEDMKKLWNLSVELYDVYKDYFRLRAMIFFTISDFPSYAKFLGYTTKGKKGMFNL